MLKLIKNTVMFLILSSALNAQMSDFEINGYTKYMQSGLSYPDYTLPFQIPDLPDVAGETFVDHLIHIRLNTKWYATEHLTAAMEFRTRAMYGESIQNIPGYKDLFFRSNYEYNDLEWFMWETNNSIGVTQIDRLWLDYYQGDFQATVGRQRVAWGTSLVWNITDLFNPMDILDFDYEERPGTDAIRAQYFTGSFSKVEVVYKPAETSRNTTYAIAWSDNFHDYDAFLLFGKRNGLWTLGGNWAGDISDGGFRGEFLLTEALSKVGPPPDQMFSLPGSFYNDDTPNFSLVLSGDYTFSNTFYIHTEMMYNSNGKTENSFLYSLEALQVGMLSPSRWSLFQEFSYDISPLTRGSLFGILNPDDLSYIVVPSVSWSFATNWQLMGIIFIGGGGEFSDFGILGQYNLTEFGYTPNAIYARVKYSF